MNNKKNLHRRKMLAPIIISAVLVLYYAAFALACTLIDGMPLFIKIIAGGVPLLIAGIVIAVLIERIREIKSGEEDDLSEY